MSRARKRRCTRCDASLDQPGHVSGSVTSLDGQATYDACHACMQLLRTHLSEAMKHFFARIA